MESRGSYTEPLHTQGLVRKSHVSCTWGLAGGFRGSQSSTVLPSKAGGGVACPHNNHDFSSNVQGQTEEGKSAGVWHASVYTYWPGMFYFVFSFFHRKPPNGAQYNGRTRAEVLRL